MIRAIACVDKNWGLGKDNHLLFKLKTDMQYFTNYTKFGICCMGYNTLLSLPKSAPLRGRINIVLAPENVCRTDCTIVHSLTAMLDAITKYQNSGAQNIFIIGGAMFYRTMLPYCEEVLITKVNAEGDADVFFENLDINPNFKLRTTSVDFIEGDYTGNFCVYENLNPVKIN